MVPDNNQHAVLTKRAISLLDLTLLDEKASTEQLQTLFHQAYEQAVAAICVYPTHLNNSVSLGDVSRATVINFPQGNEPIEPLLISIDTLLQEKRIDEIDYVFPYQDYLQGQEKKALNHCQQLINHCHHKQLRVKVIVEVSAFSNHTQLYTLSRQVIEQGCDFLKTATGRKGNPTVLAVKTLLEAIKASDLSCGLKISGGIKTPELAFFYMHLAQAFLDKPVDKSWFRLGASQLINALLSQNNP